MEVIDKFAHACERNQLEIAYDILQSNPNILMYRNELIRIFRCACFFNNHKIAQMISRHVPNFSLSDSHIDDLISFFCCKGDLESLQWFYAHPLFHEQSHRIITQNENMFVEACKYGRFNVVQWIAPLVDSQAKIIYHGRMASLSIEIIEWINARYYENLLSSYINSLIQAAEEEQQQPETEIEADAELELELETEAELITTETDYSMMCYAEYVFSAKDYHYT